jgi:acyl carrier protein
MPTREEIEQEIKDIVCQQLGVSEDKLTDETSFVNDLGADSLDTVELVMEIEDAFSLSIPDEDVEDIQTVGAAVDYVEDQKEG